MRGILCSFGLFALLAEAPAVAGLVVKSHDTTRRYWIIRTDHMRALQAPNENVRLRMVERGPYGPHPINGLPQDTKSGVQYRLFPECRGRMKPVFELAYGQQPSAWVDC